MAGFISGLTGESGITGANLWAEIVPAAGLVAALLLFRFGYNYVKGIVNNIPKPGKKTSK